MSSTATVDRKKVRELIDFEINRENAYLSEWDIIYCEILKKILKDGVLTENRTGIDTLSIEGVQFKLHNVGDIFPILETKKVTIQNALTEMLWIYQAQSNKVKWLKDRHNPIWNEWMVDSDGIYRIYEPETKNYDPNKKVKVYDLNGKPIPFMNAKSKVPGKNIKAAKFFGPRYVGTIGTAYGWIINRYKKIDEVIQTLKNNPHDRRMIISLWQEEYKKTMVLPSCVWSCMLKVSDGKLHMMVQQRSCDTPLGLPFNVSQYAILLNMLAKEAGLEVGNLSWNIMDCHVYVNQIDGVKKQLMRYELMQHAVEYIHTHTDAMIKYKYTELLRQYELTKDEMYKEAADALKHMATRTNPVLELNPNKTFYTYSNEVINDKEYKETNPTANEDIVVRGYKHRPFIKMPIAQ